MKNTLKLLGMLALLLVLAAYLTSCAAPRDPVNGKDGSSCHVTQASNGALIHCSDGSGAVVLNGANGVDAPQSLGIKGYIYPCDNVNSNKEIFLRMTDGSIVAVYDGGGGLSHLAIIQPGSYVTTDGVTCNISVDAQLNVVTSPVAATGEALND